MKWISFIAAFMLLVPTFGSEKSASLLNFQVAVRDSQGAILSNQEISVRLTLQSNPDGETVFFTETHLSTTDSHGIVHLKVGSISSASFKDVPWGQQVFVKIEVKLPSDQDFTLIDISPLLSVPFALYSEINFDHSGEEGEVLWHNGEGWVSSSRLLINQSVEVSAHPERDNEASIFLVRNSQGLVVFEVYESGVVSYIPYQDDSKGRRSGFAVGGLSDQNKTIQNYFFSIMPEEVRFNILSPSKSGRVGAGSFKISGISRDRKQAFNQLYLGPDSIRFTISTEETTKKGRRSGFAVGGLSDQTKSFKNWLRLNPDTTYLQTSINVSQGAMVSKGMEVGGDVSTMPIVDIDNNQYPTKQIGNQMWMTKNLRVTRYRTGEPINPDLFEANEASYGVYLPDLIPDIENEEAMADAYGNLYNWHAVNNSQGLCPTGWVVPNESHWNELIAFVGGESHAGALLKSTRNESTHPHPRWDSPNLGATNYSGFRALPGGYFYADGSTDFYLTLGQMGFWWSSEEQEGGGTMALAQTVSTSSTESQQMSYSKTNGFSVRCVRVNAIPPKVSTGSASEITKFSAKLNATISHNGGAEIVERGFVWGTHDKPTIENNHGIYYHEDGASSISTTISGLNANQTYYFRVFATNKAGTTYGNALSFTTSDFENCGTITDIDDNEYNTVIIGNQCWMRENLRTTRFSDGQAIGDDWDFSWEEPVYIEHENPVYGNQYNGVAALANNMCPAGWHVPSANDFEELIAYLGGNEIAGEKLKATGNNQDGNGLWDFPNPATNQSGFSGLPAGNYDSWQGIFWNVGEQTYWWSNEMLLNYKGSEKNENKETFENEIIIMGVDNISIAAYSNVGWNDNAYSIRCIWGQGKAKLDQPIVTNVSLNEITLDANVLDDGGDPEAPITQRGVLYSTSPEPTIENDLHSVSPGTVGEFSITLTGLDNNTLYYIRAFATNTHGTSYSKEVTAKTYNDVIFDIQENPYYTTRIGSQHWMAQNLKATKYSDGETDIPYHNGTETSTNPEYYTWNPYESSYAPSFGFFYSHGVVADFEKSICPVGWRIPFKEDWEQLFAELGGEHIAGGKMKTTQSGDYFGYWEAPNKGATNESGFTALPAGGYIMAGMENLYFDGVSYSAYFWSSTFDGGSGNWSVLLESGRENAMFENQHGSFAMTKATISSALSVRCMEDNSVPLITEAPVVINTSTVELRARSGFPLDGEVTVGFVWDVNPEPTIQNNSITAEINFEDDTFMEVIENLESGTNYYARAYLIFNEIDTTFYGNSVFFKTYNDKISDIDGNEYLTTKIGEQEWMAENLRVTRFNNNDGLQEIWLGNALNQDGGYYIPENGYLYSYSIVNDRDRNICPLGWRLPTEQDWITLINELGGANVAGGKMKAVDPLWNEQNEGATNSSLFSALPHGYQHSSGYYSQEGPSSYFWSITDGEMRPEDNQYFKKIIQLENYTTYVSISDYGLGISEHGTEDGGSIRCLKNFGVPVVHTKTPKGTAPGSTQVYGLVIFDQSDNIEETGFVWSTNSSPTIESNEGAIVATLSGEEFFADLIDLNANTQYYVRAYVVSELHGEQLANDVLFKTYYGTVVDADENIYNTVEINGMVWMAENLRTTKFSDGEPIEQGTIGDGWHTLIEPAYTIYTLNGGPNDNSNATDGIASTEQMMQDYGALYNWYAVEDSRICPTGWRVPTHAEVQQLINHLGGVEVAGTVLKGTAKAPDSHPRWFSPNLFATNHSGFNAVPAGSGSWDAWGIGQRAYFWTSTEGIDDRSHAWGLNSVTPNIIELELLKGDGLSIRCVME